MRPIGEIERFRAEKKSGERIWWSAKAVAGFLVALLLAQGVLWGFASWVEGREARQRALEPEVRAVEERADLAARLGDLGESRISVFERLGEMNLLRPNGIQFLSVEFREPDQFEIEGRTSEVRVLNEYIEKLRGDSRFLIREAPRPRSRDGRIEFVLAVRVPVAGKGAVHVNALRERFFRLSLRERLIGVVLLAAVGLFWASSVLGGFRDAFDRSSRVAAELEFQETVLSRSESVEAEIAARLEQMEAGRSLTASSFVEAVDGLSRQVGLTPDMDPVESRRGDMVSIHRLDMGLDDVALVPLIDFVRRMEKDGSSGFHRRNASFRK